jgi:DNA-binding response OmpR family regulator
VLLVAPSVRVARELTAALKAAGCGPVVVSDFMAAKASLLTQPDVLITEVRLGAYNGLHLAIRAAGQRMLAMVIGETDPILEAEVERHNATFLRTPVDPQHVLTVMRNRLQAARDKRRSPRKPAALDAFANDIEARLSDVSYEGMRIVAAGSQPDTLPSEFTVRLPLFNLTCSVQRVWAAQSSGEASGTSCGAELLTRDADALRAWRSLVDSLKDSGFTASG